MPRNSKLHTITTAGRDQGKTFLITEMPAAKSFKWACRALLAMAHAGVELPDEITPEMGLAALAIAGIRSMSGLQWRELEPLMDEMMTCVQYAPDQANPQVVRGLMMDVDIEEVTTLVELHAEVWTLHTGFQFPVAEWTSKMATGQ